MSETSETLYFRDLGRYDTLTVVEEKALLHLVKKGDNIALKRLILGNLRFVISVARKYQGRGLSLLELINEGNLGLYKAAKRFDDSKGVKFISYAVWWIRQSIQKALFEYVGAVRIPPNKLAMVNRFKKRLMENNGDYNVTISEAEFAGREKEIAEVMEKIIEVSLDTPISDGDVDSVSTLLDVLGDDPKQEDKNEKRELKDVISEILYELPEREGKVLKMFFGLENSREYTLDEIGKEMKLTRERVRQIKNKTLRKLLKSKDYKDILGDFKDLE
ncbi:MAG: RNA polymerase sigma factor RpoD/SigA [Fibrobacterales bacterium]